MKLGFPTDDNLCGYSPDLGTPVEAETRCRKPAAAHGRWKTAEDAPDGLYSGFLCEEHLIEYIPEIEQFHSPRADCGMAGSLWYFRENRCRVDFSGVEWELEGKTLHLSLPSPAPVPAVYVRSTGEEWRHDART